MDHASLDEIAGAVTAELDVIAEENHITIEYEVYSGQGEADGTEADRGSGYCGTAVTPSSYSDPGGSGHGRMRGGYADACDLCGDL